MSEETTLTTETNQETPTPAPKGESVPAQSATEKADPQYISKRIATAQRNTEAKILKALGVTSLDEATKKLAGVSTETQAAEKSEIEKLRATVEKETQARIKAEQKQQINTVASAIRASATGALHVEDVIEKFGLTTSLAEYLDGDEPNKRKIETKIAALRKERPSWFKTTPGSPSNNGGQIPKPEKDAMTKAKEQLQRQVKQGF